MHLKISLYVKESDGKAEANRECKDEDGKCVGETSLTVTSADTETELQTLAVKSHV